MSAPRPYFSLRAAGAAALTLALQLTPAIAMAALTSPDLAGAPRATPQATLGALEATNGLSPPHALVLTVERI